MERVRWRELDRGREWRELDVKWGEMESLMERVRWRELDGES